MRFFFAVPLLLGLLALLMVEDPVVAQAQFKGKIGKIGGGGQMPINRPAPKASPLPTPVPNPGARPTPRPSIPTPSRPLERPQPTPQPQPRPTPQIPIGQKPNLPQIKGSLPKPPISKPTIPQPVNPGNRPSIPNPLPKPSLPGGLTRPAEKPKLPNITLPSNPGNRPNVLPSLPNLPTTKPKINLPQPKPSLPPIGTKPSLPSLPERPSINWPSKPDLGGSRPKLPEIKLPDTKLPDNPIPKIKDRPQPKLPSITWPSRPNPNQPSNPSGSRPNIINRPGINLDGTWNTIINNKQNTINNTIVNQNNNYYGGNNYNFNSTRIGQSVYGYHGAWYHNYSHWQQSYHPWYHGCWHGNGFGNSWGLNTNIPWGVSAWGANSFAYRFRYYVYVNPFYVAPPPTIIVPPALNYSQPVINVVQALPESGVEPPAPPPTAAENFDLARSEFKKGNYRVAQEKTELALKEFPNDPAMIQFRALCLFALKEYQSSAAAVHALLASGPGWDWTTLSSLYDDTATYQKQLQALTDAVDAKPNDASLWFLLAYHFVTVDEAEPARTALTEARKLLPKDPVVSQLAQAVGLAPEKPPEKIEPKTPKTDPAIQLDIIGTWNTKQADGSSISLKIDKQGSFTWTIQPAMGEKDSFDGTFSLEENILVLERSAGGALMGRVTALAENQFNFKVLGGGPDDLGLTFAK
jgi:tetratricopeptide (TPR) repeat protein